MKLWTYRLLGVFSKPFTIGWFPEVAGPSGAAALAASDVAIAAPWRPIVKNLAPWGVNCMVVIDRVEPGGGWKPVLDLPTCFSSLWPSVAP